jgi:tripartite-type tricarboxylate transporter receptor subunit TctC
MGNDVGRWNKFILKGFQMKRLLAIILLVPVLAFAWEPTGPIKVIIGTQPGSGNEISFRQLAKILAERGDKTTFVIENKPGADSAIAANALYEAAPDGYTVAVLSHMSLWVTNDVWEAGVKKYNYDSFSEVLTTGKSPLVLIASPNSKINTHKEFAELMRNPDRPINIAIGGGAHRTGYEYLMSKIKGDKKQVQFVMFNGPNPALLSVAQFDVIKLGTEFGILPIAIAKPLIDAGKVKAIGIAGEHKLSQLPNVPLLNDIAPGTNVYGAWVLTLPPKTPKEIVDWYVKTFAPIVRSSEYKAWREDNLITIDERELTPQGVKFYREQLRKTFYPILKDIKQ